MHYIVHTDGGARGNPGPSAIGVVIDYCERSDKHAQGQHKTRRIYAAGKPIGERTNNVSEYMAVIDALKHIASLKKNPGDVQANIPANFYLDSTLVVNQINGVFKVKNETLRNLLFTIRLLEQEIGEPIAYASIPREDNVLADGLVNRALDTGRAIYQK